MIIVDGNSLGFIATATSKMVAGSVNTGGIFGFLSILRRIVTPNKGKILVLWDGRSWRFEKYPKYKSSRKTDPKIVELKDRWQSQKPIVIEMLTSLGVTQMWADNMEADDLAGKIIAADSGEHMLVSGDHDWCQLVRDNVTCLCPRTNILCNIHILSDVVGYKNTSDFIQAKALTGDKSDCITGVGQIGPAAAQYIFDVFGSVENMFRAYDDDLINLTEHPKKIRDFITEKEKRDTYALNLKLMHLHPKNMPKSINPKIIPGCFDKDKFQDKCAELGFYSMMHHCDVWMSSFCR